MTAALIRPAVLTDLPRLTEIYNYYVIHSPVTFDIRPWQMEERMPWFNQFALTGRHRLFVAELDDQIAAYAGTTGFRVKPAYDTTVETTVYCAPESTGRGLGSELYSVLIQALQTEDVHRIVAGYVPPNPASEALHRRFGFRQVGIFTENGYKLGRYWDVCWLERPCRTDL